ncbi:alpha/beta hydrolase [Desulfitobacterium sp.]|uniref:alpha/beta fold hydrolase n=1 Tax=Desulfitobacterium sp. TaxID=49981 RepID=UPI002B20489E|nr:alpha/beta hydrolase [Desulfitobacterium sp.]MEA4902238.1 alpha/beta hydrolase [Desulfitobacterium sp.]
MSSMIDKCELYQGSKIHYLTIGEKNERSWVVLLHGKKFTADDWENIGLLDALDRAGFKVIALNLPGYGNSEPLKSNIMLADFLAGFMHQLNIDSFHLIGPSFSGEISIQFALGYGSRLETLTLIDSVGVDQYEQRLQDIMTQTLIVWGKKDEIAPYRYALTLHEKLPSSTLYTFEDLGHTCYFEDSQTFTKILLPHLTQGTKSIKKTVIQN